MADFKRKPPSLIERWGSCFLLDYVAPPMVRAAERAGRLDRLLWKWSDRRQRHMARRNPFRGYTPQKQDVFVMTYAKSGTNWVMQIVWQLIHHCQKDFDHIHSVVPWPDAVTNTRTMRNYAIPLDMATEWRTEPERKRIIKTHLNWELVPYSEQARYIAVLRDPKDVFVSSYIFIRDFFFGAAMPSVDTMFRMFVNGKALTGGSWAANAAGYWAQRHRSNVLILSFASMKRDLEGTVRKIAAFLDIHVSNEIIQEVCRRSSFEYMKAIDERFAPYRGVPWRKHGRMMRSGQQGRSSELLSAEQQEQIDRSCVAELKREGSDLPYDEICGRTGGVAYESRSGT
jgi:hypothetical protein